ncbi:hypothetical protein ACIRFH_10950 [Streptomyces sp. NPDC093586]|uniref:hypothetical protein n=1 Tax=Streptomyces sp. NPDC093586 TaxID=3366042 RepID=UPI0037F8F8EE
MTEESERAVRAAVEGEMRLPDPGGRACPVRVLELLAPEFAENGDRRAWRSSLWRLTETGRRRYFHQGASTGTDPAGRVTA